MLATVVLTVLAVDVDAAWCDDECVTRAHPFTARRGLGGPELDYAFTVSVARVPRIHRFQVSWAVPLAEPLEVAGGVAYQTDGRFEVVPTLRYSPFKLGALLIPAIAVSTGLSVKYGQLLLTVRPALELHVGFAAMTLGFELDPSGRKAARFWCGLQAGL